MEDGVGAGDAQVHVDVMTGRKPKGPAPPPPPKRPADKAFDMWVQRGLHKIFDDVAREPIPEDLLKLIQEHREK